MVAIEPRRKFKKIKSSKDGKGKKLLKVIFNCAMYPCINQTYIPSKHTMGICVIGKPRVIKTSNMKAYSKNALKKSKTHKQVQIWPMYC